MSDKRKKGASTAEAAAHFKVDVRTINDWHHKKWLVRFEDRSIDVDSTAARVDALRDPYIGGKPDRGIVPKSARAPVRPTAGEGEDADGDPDPADIEGTVEYQEAHRRLELAKARRAELDLEVAKGNYIKREDAERVYCDSIAKARANLEAIPNRCAELLVGQTDAAVVRAMLTHEIEAALSVVAGEVPSVYGIHARITSPRV